MPCWLQLPMTFLAECFIGISSSVLKFCLHTSASRELSSVQAVVTSWRITGQGSDDCHFGENTQHLKQQVSCHQGCVSYKEVKPKHEPHAVHCLRSASCLCYLTTPWTCFPWHSLHPAPFRNSILKFRRLCLLRPDFPKGKPVIMLYIVFIIYPLKLIGPSL